MSSWSEYTHRPQKNDPPAVAAAKARMLNIERHWRDKGHDVECMMGMGGVIYVCVPDTHPWKILQRIDPEE